MDPKKTRGEERRAKCLSVKEQKKRRTVGVADTVISLDSLWVFIC